MKNLLLLGCLMAYSTAHASEFWEQQVADQLRQIELNEQQHLSFIQRIVSNDGIEEARHQPRSEQRWRLLSVDGVSATLTEQEAFAEDRQKERERRDGESLADLISPGSVTELEATSDGLIRLSFVPQVEGMKGVDALDGTLLWSESDQALRAMRITSQESFSPRFSVRIDQMEMAFQFQTFQGMTVPQRYEFTVLGKLAGLKTIDVMSTVEYLELEQVSKPQNQ